MARTVRDTNLETRAARLRLEVRRKPYWRVLETGLHIGYRRTKAGGGSWTARRFLGGGRYSEMKVGTADDLQDADGVAIRSFSQAQVAARDWWRVEERRAQGHAPHDGPYTVRDAIEAYFRDRERRGSKGVSKDRASASLRIIPQLGDLDLHKLTTRKLREWHTDLAAAPRLARMGRYAARRIATPVDPDDADDVRARRATANRTLTVIKAALNHAFHEGRTSGDEAWRKVKPFREADAPVVRFLSGEECLRLVNACEGTFRDIVRAAILTGARYGELAKLKADDFNASSATITIGASKSGKPRRIALTDEGSELFQSLTVGKVGRAPIFIRDDGKVWGPSHQQRPLEAASKRANIEPSVNFHVLRHTYASLLAMSGAPMGVIAAQLGHADTRMTERHYAHLAPNYVAETVRASLPKFGFVEKQNVASLLIQKASR
jgi:integrase